MTHFSEQAREEFQQFTEALALVHPDHKRAVVEKFTLLPTYSQCTDILPEHNCRLLDIEPGSTYGQAATHLQQELTSYAPSRATAAFAIPISLAGINFEEGEGISLAKMFQRFVEVAAGGEVRPVMISLFKLLYDKTDPFPAEGCEFLEVPTGATYGEVARVLVTRIEEQGGPVF